MRIVLVFLYKYKQEKASVFFFPKSGKPSENIASTLPVDAVCVPVPDLRRQVASFLQDSDIHLSLKKKIKE